MKIPNSGQITFSVDKATMDVVAKGNMTHYTVSATLIYDDGIDTAPYPVSITVTFLHSEKAPFRKLREPRKCCPDARALDYFVIKMAMRHQWHMDAVIEHELVRIHYFQSLGYATYTCLNEEEVTAWYTDCPCTARKEVII